MCHSQRIDWAVATSHLICCGVLNDACELQPAEYDLNKNRQFFSERIWSGGEMKRSIALDKLVYDSGPSDG